MKNKWVSILVLQKSLCCQQLAHSFFICIKLVNYITKWAILLLVQDRMMFLITHRFNPISTTHSGFFFAFQVKSWKELWMISVKLTWLMLMTEITFFLLLFCLVCDQLLIMCFYFRMRLHRFFRIQIHGLERNIYRSVVTQLFI
jgi:hypothetical protein